MKVLVFLFKCGQYLLGNSLLVIMNFAENTEMFYSVVTKLDIDNSSFTSILRDKFKDPKELKVLKTDLASIHQKCQFSVIVQKQRWKNATMISIITDANLRLIT